MNLIEGGFPVERRPADTIPATAPAAAAESVTPTTTPAPAAPVEGARAGRSWVPIRSLGPRHRERIVAHLQALDVRSRYLRFGHQASDGQIGRYVDTLDFEHDEVFGIFNRRLRADRDGAPGYRGRPTAPQRSQRSSASRSCRTRGAAVRRLFEHACCMRATAASSRSSSMP